MKKARFLTVIGIIILAALLIAGSPVTRVKADHCHATQSQAPAASAQPPAQHAPSNADRSRSSRRVTTPVRAPQNAQTQSKPAGSTTTPSSAATASIEDIYSRDLPLAMQSIGQAIKAIESGDRQTELAELTRAVTLLSAIHESLGKHVKAPSTPSMSFRRGSAGVLSEASESKDLSPSTPSAAGAGAQAARPQARDLANSRCPIMGSPIKPESVTANLTRDYKGQQIGFCCAGCPAAWDKLTDAEKQAKLNAVKS